MADLLKSNHSHLFHSRKHHDHDGRRGEEHDHHDDEATLLSPVVHHGGITKEQTLEAFQSAGLTEIDFAIIHTIQKGDNEIEIFLAKGKKV